MENKKDKKLIVARSPILAWRDYPTVFRWRDERGNEVRFSLGYGCWNIYNITTDIIICEGDADGFLDGECEWEDVMRYAAKEGYCLVESYASFKTKLIKWIKSFKNNS